MSQDVERWKRELTEAGWTAASATAWWDPTGGLYRGPYGAWKELQRRNGVILGDDKGPEAFEDWWRSGDSYSAKNDWPAKKAARAAWRAAFSAAIIIAESTFEGGGEVTHKHIEVGREIVAVLERAADSGEGGEDGKTR